MLEYEIRPAAEAESGQIRNLIHEVGINPTGLDWRRFFVAVEGPGRVIGCGQVKPHGQDILELASIAVSPERRGRGIARQIIAALLEQNPRPLYLMCMEHNGGLYEKFGFRRLEPGQMPRYFQKIHKLFGLAEVIRKTGEELLVMKLE